MNKQDGFSPIIIVAVIAVVAIVGFVGWRVYDAQSTNNDKATNTVQTTQEPSIETTQDVVKAEQDLNSLSIDDELDSAVLDEDISNLQ